LTGQPVNTGIPVPTTTIAVVNTTAAPVTTLVPPAVMTTTKPTPTPSTTWNKTVQNLSFCQFIDLWCQPDRGNTDGTRFDNLPPNTNMTSFAKINGKSSGQPRL